MEFELMDMLVQFLCPTSNAASSCQSFISSHSSVMPPFGQYIYFLFFPTVFLLFFLWIVFKDAIKANKGISLIATIAVYVFIIIQGLYPIFLALGELWIVVIFLLGFFYVLIHRFRKGDGGGKGGGMTAAGGATTAAGSWIKEAMFGTTPLDPRERLRQKKLLQDQIRILDAQIKEQSDEMKGVSGDRERSEIRAKISQLQTDRKALEIKAKSL